MPRGLVKDETLMARYPGLSLEEARERHNQLKKEAGRRGGSAKVPKGFAFNRRLASDAGRKGGRISRRRPKDAA